MASEVLITLPSATSFQNHVQNVERNEFVRILNTNSENNEANFTNPAKDSICRIDELQKTIHFLKDEQKRMLNSLHQEIVSLQEKNRDLLCQLIFKADHNVEYENIIGDNDVKFILTSRENKQKQNVVKYSTSANNILEETSNLKYTIGQQQQQIEYLKEQLKLISLCNKTQNHGSRQADVYIRELEDRNREQEKLIRLLRKENKDQKSEMENLRKTLSHIRLNSQLPQNIQITHHVQSQAQLFPTPGTPSTFWCHQNSSVPITEYQLQRNNINTSANERASTIPRVSFTLPPVYNYGQIAVTTPVPNFYGNTSYFYSIAQRPIIKSKSYANDNIRPLNRNIQNGSNV